MFDVVVHPRRPFLYEVTSYLIATTWSDSRGEATVRAVVPLGIRPGYKISDRFVCRLCDLAIVDDPPDLFQTWRVKVQGEKGHVSSSTGRSRFRYATDDLQVVEFVTYLVSYSQAPALL